MGSYSELCTPLSEIISLHLLHLRQHLIYQTRRLQHLAIRPVFEDVHDQFTVIGVGHPQKVAAIFA